ncbi:MAG: recombinase family protein [Candidatus Heimdallarchaeota archaeon]|nr:recombinase family protein [Candidatus Heimdallarchaeota archaeon]MCK4877397.1 recombinase family protein [Candidatus Heimdallarchaeota archaeon]
MEDELKAKMKEKLQNKLDKQVNDLTEETIAEIKEENESLQLELSDTERELPVMDEAIRELHVSTLEKQEISAPFGYYIKKNKLRIKDEEARTVKLIFSWFYKQKKSLEEISEKAQLTITKIKNILINPVYFGRVFLNGEIRKGKHPAIIDKHYCKLCNINADKIVQNFLASSIK